jgi:hypothetical protein
LSFGQKRQTLQWPKDKQYNGQKPNATIDKGQAIQWPKTNDTMAKRQTIQ